MDSCSEELREEAENSTNGMRAKIFQLKLLTLMSYVVSEMGGKSSESINAKQTTDSSIVDRDKIAEGVDNSVVRS